MELPVQVFISNHLSQLTNDELQERVKLAEQDLAAVSQSQPESEWHNACFSGLLVYAEEAKRRGLN